jgi:NAD(P)-dependent dehydrogenase (short-subunit alcohol dehydrogenase family)
MKQSFHHKPLSGKVAVVAGATRGAGRGVARMLGEAGAMVYCCYYHLHLDLTRAEETSRMSAILWPPSHSQRNHD